MKRLLFVVLAAAAFAAGGCATAGLFVPQIQIDSPLAQQMGGNSVIYGQPMSVVNTLSAYCSIAVGSKEVATLAPAQSAYDVRHWEPLYPALPLVARCYADATRKEYLGAAAHIFYPSSYDALVWEITPAEMRWARNGVAQTVNAPAQPPIGNPTSIKVEFPREAWNATALLQVVSNVEGAAGYVSIDGQAVGPGPLGMGDLFFSASRLLSGWGRQRTLTLRFLDEKGRFIGSYTAYFSVPGQGIQAYQLVVGLNDLRR